MAAAQVYRVGAMQSSALKMVSTVAWFACSVALANGANPPPPSARQVALENLLLQDCGSCHGLTMKGGLGPALLPAALQGKSDAVLVATILHGRPGTAMPPWNHELSAVEAQWLVSRLRAGVQSNE